MSEAEFTNLTKDQFTDNQLGEEEVWLAARKAFTFQASCVDGQVEGVRAGNRIMAARTLLEHSAKVRGLMGDHGALVGMASEEDVAVIATVLD